MEQAVGGSGAPGQVTSGAEAPPSVTGSWGRSPGSGDTWGGSSALCGGSREPGLQGATRPCECPCQKTPHRRRPDYSEGLQLG